MSAGLSIKFEKEKLNMSGIKATGRTIGEVENLTGIPKRELKYFIEQKIMRPSQRTESGYWLYSDEDIWRARLAFLCRELDFPTRVIRMILADPIRCWQQELERQIVRLTDKRARRVPVGPRGDAAAQLGGRGMGRPAANARRGGLMCPLFTVTAKKETSYLIKKYGR